MTLEDVVRWALQARDFKDFQETLEVFTRFEAEEEKRRSAEHSRPHGGSHD